MNDTLKINKLLLLNIINESKDKEVINKLLLLLKDYLIILNKIKINMKLIEFDCSSKYHEYKRKLENIKY